MKINHNGNKTANFLKGVFFIAFLGLVSGCGGGGGSTPGLSLTADNGTSGSTVAGESALPGTNQINAKADLCTEVNGWETSCRFLGIQYLEMNETITPLTEEFSGKNRGRGGDA